MKEIKLTQGKVALVDDEDFLFLNKWNWIYEKNGHNEYAKKRYWDAVARKQVTVYMHRLIMGMPGLMTIDHIDHNGLNNQKTNLRICTHAENLRNSVNGNRKKTSKYRGVSITADGTIIAYYDYNGKRKYIGSFKTEEDAARARDIEVSKISRNFYVFNFPV